MTIDEAIKHAEEVADLCEYEASKYDMSDFYESHVACQEGKCGEEHRQLAEWLRDYKRLLEQESKTNKYEYHTDHTDCIWYGNDSGCPVTYSQYRDGWNDTMVYIFKNGNGYQPYRHDR